jgi:hypothetical protein
MNDKNIAELAQLLTKHNAEKPLNDLREAAKFIDMAEKRHAEAMKVITGLKEQIDGLKGENSQLKSLLLEELGKMRQELSQSQGLLAKLKQAFVEGAKKFVEAIKQTGRVVKYNAYKFIWPKEQLQACKSFYTGTVMKAEKRIAAIESFSASIHETSASIRNAGKAMYGATPVKPRENGRITKAITAPMRFMKARDEMILAATNRRLDRLASLESAVKNGRRSNIRETGISKQEAPEQRREESRGARDNQLNPRKPSVLAALGEKKALIAERQRALPEKSIQRAATAI